MGRTYLIWVGFFANINAWLLIFLKKKKMMEKCKDFHVETFKLAQKKKSLGRSHLSDHRCWYGLNDDDRRWFVQLVLDGKKYGDLKREGGPHRITILRWAEKLGINLLLRKKTPKKSPGRDPEKIALAVSLYEEGHSIGTIAFKVGVSALRCIVYWSMVSVP